MHDAIKQRFLRKGGGKWFYGPDPVRGDFSNHDNNASFKDNPYSYMVERSVFDKLLLDHSESCGADVRYQHKVTDVIENGTRIVGVRTEDADKQKGDFHGKVVFDCSGLRAVVSNRLNLRHPNSLKRCAIHAHYNARAVDDDLKNGWFVGRMFYDGWTWLIPLEEDLISVGVVLSVDQYQQVKEEPEEFLDSMVRSDELLRSGMTTDARRVSEVRVNGNVGFTSDRFAGDGWVLVGDAAFFIDPCYSSGVHVALHSAELAADAFLRGTTGKNNFAGINFEQYEQKLRDHERIVTKMVDAFYTASRNPVFRRTTVLAHRYSGDGTRKFVTFVGGDFDRNTSFISNIHRTARMIDFVFGKRRVKSKVPDLHPGP